MSRIDAVNPAAFPLGSPESRAAARLLAMTRKPMTTTILEDTDGNPIWDPDTVYGPRLDPLVGKLTNEEWDREYGTWEAREGMYRRGERRDINRAAWQAAYVQLVKECGGRVPGSLAAARIPKGKPVWHDELWEDGP